MAAPLARALHVSQAKHAFNKLRVVSDHQLMLYQFERRTPRGIEISIFNRGNLERLQISQQICQIDRFTIARKFGWLM